jgi:hypothetical protein
MTRRFKLRNAALLISNVLLNTLIISCGGTSSTNNATPAPQTAQIIPPSGTPLPSGDSASTVYLNGNTLSVPGSNAYINVTLADGPTTTALINAASSITSTTYANGGVIMQTPTEAFFVPIAPPSSLNSIAPLNNGSLLYGNSNESIGATISAFTYDISISAPIIISLTNNPNANSQLFPYTGLAIESMLLSNCVNGENTTVAYGTNYNNTAYTGIGTNLGSVCVYNGSWNNLTSQARNNGYTNTGPILAFSFSTPSGTSNIFGYWLTSSGQLWRVTATSAIQPQNFWQLNNPNTQTCTASPCSGQSVQFGSVPPAEIITSMISDAQNNVFVGTNTGAVYALGNGKTSWGITTATTTGCTGASLFVAPNPGNNNVGALASCMVNGTNKVLAISL